MAKLFFEEEGGVGNYPSLLGNTPSSWQELSGHAEDDEDSAVVVETVEELMDEALDVIWTLHGENHSNEILKIFEAAWDALSEEDKARIQTNGLSS